MKKELNHDVIEGVVSGHRDGHGFIVRSDGGPDLYVPAHMMQSVLHGDQVRAMIAGYDRKGRAEAQITDIVSRSPQLIIGRLLQENGVWLVAPEDNRYKQDILIVENGLAHAHSGQVVTVELTEQPTLYSQPVGRIVEVLGEIDDPGMEIEIAVRKFNVPHVFTDAVLKETEGLPEKVRAADKRNRIDLTDVPLVTIDGEDARDFDDAVYCEPAQVGKSKGYRLLVAIADVSHYVRPGTALDASAYERATSVYFPRRVIPMLPEKISNGLCSLVPHEDRLCLVCDMLITKQGQTHAYQFYPAVIRSHARLTYTEVAEILVNPSGPQAQLRGERVQDLLHLNGVFQALYGARQKRGAIDMDTVETRIVCDEAGQIERIEPYERTQAHRLIEEAMLVANVCAAEFVEHHKQTCLFRVHEGPTPEKKEALQNYLNAMAVNVVLSEEPTPAEFQRIAELTKDRVEASQIQLMLLKSMQQAVYTPTNSGHFGLAYDAYTHFTSPIRRYPDLLLHRVIHGILSGRKYVLDDRTALSNLVSVGKSKVVDKNPTNAPHSAKPVSALMQAWVVAGMHCSANERRADDASRDVLAWLKCMYIRNYLGEQFTGTVTAATSFGLFVQLDSMYVEGLIHISELGSDYFTFDEVHQELKGERSGIRYALGSHVDVQVSRVDLDGRRVDFRLVQDGLDNYQGKSARRGSKNGKSDRSGKAGSSARTSKSTQPVAGATGASTALDELKNAVKRATRKAVKAVKERKPKHK